MSIVKTSVNLTHDQVAKIMKITADVQMKTGERFNQSDWLRSAVDAALQTPALVIREDSKSKRQMLIEFSPEAWRTIEGKSPTDVSREISNIVCDKYNISQMEAV